MTRTFEIAVPPDIVRKFGLLAVDVVAYRLADEMRGDGMALEAMFFQKGALGIAIGEVGFRHLEVVSPAGEFHPIVAKRFGLLHDGGGRHVRPLTCKESYCSWHEIRVVMGVYATVGRWEAGMDRIIFPNVRHCIAKTNCFKDSKASPKVYAREEPQGHQALNRAAARPFAILQRSCEVGLGLRGPTTYSTPIFVRHLSRSEMVANLQNHVSNRHRIAITRVLRKPPVDRICQLEI